MRASRLIRAVLFPPLRKYTMKTTKRLYGANTVLYTSVTVMCPVPFPRLCFLLQCSVKLAACFGFGLVILQSSHGWNFFLLSHTVKYFLPLVCRYLLRRFEKCRFYFFGSLLCPSVLQSRLCPVLLLCRHASFLSFPPGATSAFFNIACKPAS